MSPSIAQQLPADVYFLICNHLSSETDLYQSDIRALSFTCRHAYDTLIPLIFKRLVLQDERVSAASVAICPPSLDGDQNESEDENEEEEAKKAREEKKRIKNHVPSK
ncbi:hypothetical protein AJ80_03754 [Polytolypa hystricis UAMH7299]|uniref:F-box domain-containing protein n=1 Tax=Polytolypa hystricis (strain UAMH7299) TaxID=1447883 RepID=A0A2B7YGV3_POLH7|nr:hypothetical protein AJ80_03754 [Polytolypa hystricis UAMH7299]